MEHAICCTTASELNFVAKAWLKFQSVDMSKRHLGVISHLNHIQCQLAYIVLGFKLVCCEWWADGPDSCMYQKIALHRPAETPGDRPTTAITIFKTPKFTERSTDFGFQKPSYLGILRAIPSEKWPEIEMSTGSRRRGWELVRLSSERELWEVRLEKRPWNTANCGMEVIAFKGLMFFLIYHQLTTVGFGSPSCETYQLEYDQEKVRELKMPLTPLKE